MNYENSQKLEKLLSNECSKDFAACSFATNHKSYSISPMFLDKHGIDYTLVIQKPGDLITTNVGCHHMVANLSPTIAYAINISVPYIMEYDDPPVCDCSEKREKPVLGIDLVRKYEGLLVKSKDQAQKIAQFGNEMKKEKKLICELKRALEENWNEKDIYIKHMGEKETEFKREINALKEMLQKKKDEVVNLDHQRNDSYDTLTTDVVVESYNSDRRMTHSPYGGGTSRRESNVPQRRVHFSRKSIDKQSIGRHSFGAFGQSLLRKEQHCEHQPQKAKCVCLFCGVSISNEGNLRRHILSCLGIKPYSCSICNREYAREENLKDHLRTDSHALRCNFGSMDDDSMALNSERISSKCSH